jgi:Golgi phosphoprotein 3
MDINLNLLEKYLLIALDDDKGKFVNDSIHLHYGFAGAILLELAIRDKIEISGERIRLKEKSTEKEVALNKAIELLNEEGGMSSRDCINKLSKKASEFKEDTLQRLINKGVLEKKEGKILWIIPNHKYPTQNILPESKLRERLNEVVLHDKKATAEDIMLLSLINVSNLTKEAFRNIDDRKVLKKKIVAMTSDMKLSQVINSSIREIQAAIMIAITTAVVVTTVTNH